MYCTNSSSTYTHARAHDIVIIFSTHYCCTYYYNVRVVIICILLYYMIFITLLWAHCEAALLYRPRHISVCCVAKLDNGIRCGARTLYTSYACPCVRALVRLCVAVAGVAIPASEGVSRVLLGRAVRRGWA